jgi:hypothetical protein
MHSMLPPVVIAAPALITGGFQVIDGVHVLATGTYVGPETPGPWRHVANALGLDPFALGPVFILLGCCWLTAAAVLLATSSTTAWWALFVSSVMTLWYLPVGTVTALATIAVLIQARTQLTDAG